MPPPIAVKLVAHDETWALTAAAEAMRLRQSLRSIIEVHHIGSTAVPGMLAKPIRR